MEKYVPHLSAAFWVFGFCAFLIVLGGLFRSSKIKEKQKRPDLGASTENIKFTARYHTVLCISVLLFLGILVLVPASTGFRQWIEAGKGWSALIELGLFLFLLCIAVFFAWSKGDLSWVRDSENARRDI